MTITNNDDLWLTAVLRPAGVLSASAVERLAEEMTSVARTANIVVVNLVAAQVTDVEALAAALKGPGSLLSAPDKCLLLVGADEELLAALDRAGGEIAAIETEPTPDADLALVA
ncbi:hypothetical protein GCM10009682_42010 [Luedemannella flava]|uniref:STAS domain-containing protein n=1 Tax=Luedemannella flava TaxID=349316 RepID=A0ABP4YGW4_9ACTN